MNMNAAQLIDLQAKIISALMTKLCTARITLGDSDVEEAAAFIGAESGEVEVSYDYKPRSGIVTIIMQKPTE